MFLLSSLLLPFSLKDLKLKLSLLSLKALNLKDKKTKDIIRVIVGLYILYIILGAARVSYIKVAILLVIRI